MSPLRCCVIDDEPLAGRLIASYVERTPTLVLCGTYQSATDAIKPIMGGEIDLVFLDIEMPQITGIEFAKIVPPTCRIIFTTAYDQYAVQGFRVRAIDYLLKPISYDEFLEATNRAVEAFQTLITASPAPAPAPAQREFLLVKSEYKIIQIRISDILYVEGLKDYVKIYVDGMPKPVLTLMSMKTVEQSLPRQKFMRVHRSFIINTDRISIIERTHLIIAGQVIPISDSYRPQFAEYIAANGAITADD